MPRPKKAKKIKKEYPPGYFDFDPNTGSRSTKEIVEFLFSELELKAIAFSVHQRLSSDPKSIRAIAEELDMLGRQLPILYVLWQMSAQKAAIGSAETGFIQGSCLLRTELF